LAPSDPHFERALEKYRDLLQEAGATPKQYTLPGKIPERMEVLCHVLWMIPNVLRIAREGNSLAAAGALGWIEGVLWSQQLATYETLPGS